MRKTRENNYNIAVYNRNYYDYNFMIVGTCV